MVEKDPSLHGGAFRGVVGRDGFSEAEAKFYEENVDTGNILLSVEFDDGPQKQKIQEIFDETEGKQVSAA